MHSLGHPPTLLLVDDDKGLLRLMQSAFKREGCVTALARSGDEAVAWLRDHHADLVLLDLKLQDMTGAEVLERLREIGCDVPFIIITGQGDERVAVEMMKRGAFDYLVKDTTFLEVLPTVVQRAVRQISQQRRLVAAEAAAQASQALTQVVLNSLPAAIAVLDPEGVIVATNEPWERFAKIASGPKIFQASVGASYLELCRGVSGTPVDGAIQILSAVERVLNGGASVALEFSHGENEQAQWFGCSVSPMNGGRKGAVLTHFDVTERKVLEAEVLQIAERERERVAADLHDGICQEITGISFNVSALERKLHSRKSRFVPAVKKIVADLSDAVAHTRQVARGLSPVVNDGLGLMHALRTLAETTMDLRRIACRFDCAGNVEIADPVIANQLYRIAQEAVTNAVRHARASEIILRLERRGDALRLGVEDDGQGIQKPEASSGIGLRAMHYRARLIGGEVRAEPRAGGGTVITCDVPAIKLPPDRLDR